MVVKSKPTDIEVCNMANKMAQACGLSLAVLYEKYKLNTDFRYEVDTYMYVILGLFLAFHCRFCSQRELELCRLSNPVLKQFSPAVYHTIMDPRKVRGFK